METEAIVADAVARGHAQVEYFARRQHYVVDFRTMQQVNVRTFASRAIRCVEVNELADAVQTKANVRSPRLACLVDHLLSSRVQVQLPEEMKEESARLNQEQVRAVFVESVPGVEQWLYRDMPGQYALNFIVLAYFNGIQSFQGTSIHK